MKETAYIYISTPSNPGNIVIRCQVTGTTYEKRHRIFKCAEWESNLMFPNEPYSMFFYFN